VTRLADELVAVRERPLQAACDELIGRMLPEGAEDDVALVAVRLRG
jgi:two-component system, chemotaxis family, sensor kinase Cph1